MKEDIKATILEFLIKKRCIGGAHTPLGRLKSCVELHSNQEKKAFEDALDELVKQSWIFAQSKRTGKGSDTHLSVNPRMLTEIMEYLTI